MGIRVHFGGQTVKLRQKRATCRLPLAPIVPPRMLLDRLRDLGPVDATLQLHLDMIQHPHFARFVKNRLMERRAANQTRPRDAVSRKFSSGDVEMLETNEVLTRGKAHLYLPAFKVPKSNGTSSRFVVDGRDFNDLISDIRFDMNLPDIQQVVDDFATHKYCFMADGASFFYQFEIHRELGELLGVKLASRRGDFKSFIHRALSMGIKPAPAIAQSVASFVAASCVEEGVKAWAWVDNFFFLSNDMAALLRTRDRFAAACHHVNLALGEFSSVVETGEFLGLRFGENGVSASSSSRDAVREAVDALAATPSTRTLLRAVGSTLWLNHTILRKRLASFPHLFALVSDTVRKTLLSEQVDWDRALVVPPDAATELAGWVDEALAATHRGGRSGDGSQLYTDASDQALGFVLLRAQRMVAGARRLTEEEAQWPIFLRELLAIVDGVEWAAQQGASPSVVWCDNTAALGIFRKGHSSHQGANTLLLQAGHVPNIGFVPSNCNLADEPSRLSSVVTRTRCSHPHATNRTRWGGERGS